MANKPEDICVSFETAKALHGAGIVVESLYSWFSGKGWNWDSYKDFETLKRTGHKIWVNNYVYNIYPAPTAEELIRLLPKTIRVKNNYVYHLVLLLREEGIEAFYAYWTHEWNFLDGVGKIVESDNLCEALAKMLIWLKEAGYELGQSDQRNA